MNGDATERELDQRMVDRILDTMRELGPGFAFAGRQAHLDIGGDDSYIDLLCFHGEQLRYAVIELVRRLNRLTLGTESLTGEPFEPSERSANDYE